MFEDKSAARFPNIEGTTENISTDWRTEWNNWLPSQLNN